MVIKVGPEKTFLSELLSRVGAGLQGYGASQQQLREQEAQADQQQQLAQFYQQQGLPATLINQPEWVQKKLVSESLRPESLAEWLGSYFDGGKKAKLAQQLGPQPISFNVGEQQVQLSPENISPDMAQKLQEFGIQATPQGQSSFGQNISSGALGATTQTLGLPGDIASLGLSGVQALNERPQLKSALINNLARTLGIPFDLASAVEKGAQFVPEAQTLQSYVPTTENISNALKKQVKGTIFEPYVVPQSETQQWAEKIGNYISLLSNPVSAARKGGIGLVKDLAKATGVALGADTAGWFTQRATGSEQLGDIVRNGSMLLYNVFPGTFRQVSNNAYEKFNKEVLEKAAQKNIKIDPTRYRNKFDEVAKVFDKQFDVGSEARAKLMPFMQRTEELIQGKSGIDPEAFINLKREVGSAIGKLPKEAKYAANKLYDFQKDIIQNFANKVTPKGAELLKNADSIFTSSKATEQAMESIKKNILPRNLGLGTMLLFAGGYKPALALGGGMVGLNYVSKMLNNSSIRSTVSQLIKANAAQNTQLVNRLAQKLNKQAVNLDPDQAQAIWQLIQQEKSQS